MRTIWSSAAAAPLGHDTARGGRPLAARVHVTPPRIVAPILSTSEAAANGRNRAAPGGLSVDAVRSGAGAGEAGSAPRPTSNKAASSEIIVFPGKVAPIYRLCRSLESGRDLLSLSKGAD